MEDNLVVKIFRRVILWSLLIIIFIFFTVNDFKPWILGYVFGMSISMTNFLLLKKSIEKSVKMDPDNASRYATSQYFVRMMIYALVLMIGARADYLSFLAVFFGILAVKIVIVLSNIIDKSFLKR